MKLCESAPCLVFLFTSFTICEGTSFLILDARKTFATDEFIKPYHRLKPFHQAPEGRVLIRRAKPEHSLTCNLSKWSCQPHSRDFNVISLSLTVSFRNFRFSLRFPTRLTQGNRTAETLMLYRCL